MTLADAHLQQNLVHPLDHLGTEWSSIKKISIRVVFKTIYLPNVRNFAILDQRCAHPNIEQQWKERLLPWRQPGGLEVEVELDELGVHVVDVQLERNPAEVEDVAGVVAADLGAVRGVELHAGALRQRTDAGPASNTDQLLVKTVQEDCQELKQNIFNNSDVWSSLSLSPPGSRAGGTRQTGRSWWRKYP